MVQGAPFLLLYLGRSKPGIVCTTEKMQLSILFLFLIFFCRSLFFFFLMWNIILQYLHKTQWKKNKVVCSQRRGHARYKNMGNIYRPTEGNQKLQSNSLLI